MRNRPTIDGRRTTSSGFARLLTRLHHDPDRAAAEYERLRAALEKFFDWHGAWPPDECADETLDRLTVKLTSETPIDDVRAYARGIARLVLLEWRRRPSAVPIDDRAERHADRSIALADDDDDDALPACFEHCLAALPAEMRTLVLEYYVDDRRAKIEHRRRLAVSLGLSESALRNRVQRVRNRLERCVETCTAAAARVGLEAATRPSLEVSRSDDQ